ncbi:MAG: hypothetical protein IKU66_05260 [Clostridia bacterium]|nr:hypothetical protein [Clostridia bacterium]
MVENENLVTEVTENVETATEETVEQVETPAPRTYTQEELDEIVSKRKARSEAKIRKEYERKYGRLENVLKAGTGKESVEEMTDTFAQFYRSKGIDIQEEPTLSKRDTEILAQYEANEIIKLGFEDVIEEADRLKDLGVENMTAKEKAVFVALTNHIKSTETSRELAKIGVTEDVYNSAEFNAFASKFSSNTPITEIYEIYNKTQPKKQIHTMGSIKNNTADKSAVKDYYSPEEARKFTQKDFDDNPALLESVLDSMTKWKK